MTLALGIDIGGTSTRMLLLDAGDRVAAERKSATPEASGDDFVAALGAATEEFLIASGSGWDEVAGTGIALAAPVDATGSLPFVPNLPLPHGYPLAAMWRRWHPGRLTLLNDVVGALEAERRWGAARQKEQALMLSISTGIGAALLVGGTILRGAGGLAGEVGHMVFESPTEGRLCGCGRRGCWETRASGRAAGQRFEAAGGAGGARGLLEAARRGEERALVVLAGVATDIGFGISSLVLILGPECIILYGGFGTAAWDLLEQQVTATLIARRTPVAIVHSALGDNAGALGAAALARTASGTDTRGF